MHGEGMFVEERFMKDDDYLFPVIQLLTPPLTSLLNNSHKNLGASEFHGPHHPPQLT